jgi:hypothetical protein
MPQTALAIKSAAPPAAFIRAKSGGRLPGALQGKDRNVRGGGFFDEGVRRPAIEPANASDLHC